MPHRSKKYLKTVIDSIEIFQFEQFMSDRELSLEAWLSPTMVSKIKKWTTLPKLSTLKKLKNVWVMIPKPSRDTIAELSNTRVPWNQWDSATSTPSHTTANTLPITHEISF